MVSIAARISEAMNLRGLKQADLSERTGIGKSSISTYLAGEYEPKQKNLYRLASALEVNPSWLMGLDVPMDAPINADNVKKCSDEHRFEWARPIVDAYTAADVSTQKATCAVLSIPHVIPDLSISGDEEEDYDEADIFDYSSAAGSGNYVEASSTEIMRFPAGTIPNGTDCGIRISGHSMEPDIHDGDIVWVQETCEILNHQVGIFIINGDNAVCKRAKKDENGYLIRLMSDNPAIPDIEVSDLESIRVFGHVLGAYTPK